MRHPTRVIAQTLAVDAVTADLDRALGDAAIPFALLKGPTVARWLYRSTATRPYRDVDLLVAPSRLPEARKVLIDRGYRDRLHGAASWERHLVHESWLSPQQILVELHWTFFGVNAPPDDAWSELTRGLGTLDVAGRSVPMLSEPGRAMLVALHACQHGVQAGTPMADLERACRVLPLAIWRDADRLAGRVRASEAFAVGLRLHPSGVAVAEQLMLDHPKNRDLRLMATSAPSHVQTVSQLMHLRGVDRLVFMRRKAFPTRTFMRYRYGLDGSRWRLYVAYLSRWASFARAALRDHARLASEAMRHGR